MTENQNNIWAIEDGIKYGIVVFAISAVSLTYFGFKITIPFVDAFSWQQVPDLSRAVIHFWLAKIGWETAAWGVETKAIHDSGAGISFLAHLYLPAAMAVLAGAWVGYQTSKPVDGLIHVRGTRYFSGSRAIRRGRRVAHAEVVNSVPGIYIHPSLRLSHSRELLGFLILGSPGSGKTQIIWSAFLQLVEQTHSKILILDNKGDFTSQIRSSCSILLAPWDARSEAWDVGATIVSELDAELFATSTVPLSKGENSVFSKAARLMLTGVIVCLQKKHGTKWGWVDLARALEAPPGEIIESFTREFPIGLKIFRENSRTSDSVVFDLVTQLSFIRHLATAWPNSVGKFNLYDWINDETGCKIVLILQANKAYASVSDPLCCAVLNILSRQILSPQFSESASRRLYFLLDEIAQIPYVEQLKNLVALGRSKGVSIWLGVQDVGLLIDMYGRHEIESIVSMLRTKVVLQIGAGQGADFAAKLLGSREVEQHTPSKNRDGSENIAAARQRLMQQLVLPDQVSNLRLASFKNGIEGWLSVDGWGSTMQFYWPVKKIPTERTGLVLADWVKSDIDRKPPSSADAANQENIVRGDQTSFTHKNVKVKVRRKIK